MTQGLAHYAIKDHVAIVQIDHPPMNALDVPTKEALARIFQELDDRRHEIRAVILRGAGDKAFAAGADIKSFLELRPDTAKRRLMRSHQIYQMIEAFEWPVIAAIHGFCLGGGLELALCCDIRYCEETAQLGFPEVKLSIFPGNGGTRRALYNVSLGKVKELMFSGDIIDGREAFRIGLVEQLAPPGEVMERALSLAARITQRGPLGVRAAKKVLNGTKDLGLHAGLDLESDVWASLSATRDMKEGAKAFIEKRKPTWEMK